MAILGLFCSGLIGAYLSLLVFFSFVTHPVGYCVLLVTASVCISVFSYLLLGFSWYLALFILVYVGGVYVLFVFISLCSPNSFSSIGGDPVLFFLLFISFFLVFLVFDLFSCASYDTSHYLCSFMEGLSYLLLCLSLLIGLVGVSIVSSRKDSFFR